MVMGTSSMTSRRRWALHAPKAMTRDFRAPYKSRPALVAFAELDLKCSSLPDKIAARSAAPLGTAALSCEIRQLRESRNQESLFRNQEFGARGGAVFAAPKELFSHDTFERSILRFLLLL